MHAGFVRTIRRPVQLLIAAGVLIGGSVFGHAAVSAHNDTAADHALPAAVSAYLRAYESPLADHVTIEVTDRAGAYVRAQITPIDAEAHDPATAFAKYEHGTWTVLGIGTAFLPEDCAALELPATLPCQ